MEKNVLLSSTFSTTIEAAAINHTHTPEEAGAAPASHTHTADEVSGVCTKEEMGIIMESSDSGAIAGYLAFVKNNNTDEVSAAFGKSNEETNMAIGKALTMYANFKGETENIEYLEGKKTFSELVATNKKEIAKTPTVYSLVKSNTYAFEKLKSTNSGMPDIVLFDAGSTDYLNFSSATKWILNNNNTVTVGENITLHGHVEDKTAQTTVLTYTVPLSSQLPDLTFYRYLNVKLSDTVASNFGMAYGGVSATLSVAGQTVTIYSSGQMYSGVTITGRLAKTDCFDALLSNPSSANLTINVALSTYNDDTVTSNLNISKIWFSEI